jgi:hypothetical protein
VTTPRVEQQLGAVRFALERAIPKPWTVEDVSRRTDYRGNEALTVTVTDGVHKMQSKHEFDELPADVAKVYAQRIQLVRTF